MDGLDPLQGLLKPCPGLGEIRLHRDSSPPKYILELHLLLILKDEPNLPWVTGAGPHQVGGHPNPLEGPADDQTIANSRDDGTAGGST